MAIQFLENEAIDFAKWDQAIHADLSGLPYAYSWYLDCFAGGYWAGLVEGDYDKVMPLPWNAKLFGVKQIFQPAISQQLGVFGSQVTFEDRIRFLQAIPSQFKYVLSSLFTNGERLLGEQVLGQFRQRTNLVLNLKAAYPDLFQNYSKSLRKRIRKARTLQAIEESDNVEALIHLYQEELKDKVKLKQKTYEQIHKLFETLLAHKMGALLEAKDLKGDILGRAFFIVTDRRIINVFGASALKGKEFFSMHLMIDEMVKKYALQDKYFDFEGSEVPGVAAFFRSFGAQEEYYLEYKRDTLPSLLSRIRERRFFLMA